MRPSDSSATASNEACARSVRAFDDQGMTIGAEVVEGEIERVMAHSFDNERTSYLHIHDAKPGCHAVHVARARPRKSMPGDEIGNTRAADHLSADQ